jgi:hypothetical protein
LQVFDVYAKDKELYIYIKNLLKMDNEIIIEDDLINNDHVVFKQDTLFNEMGTGMREIRRKGKLCDVILKVSIFILY